MPQYGLSCNANSAACRAILNGTKNPEQEQVNAFESIIRCQFCVFFLFSLHRFISSMFVNDFFFGLFLLDVHANSISLFHPFHFLLGSFSANYRFSFHFLRKKRACVSQTRFGCIFFFYILWYSKNQNVKKHISNCNADFHFEFDGFHWRAAIYTSTNLIVWEKLVGFFKIFFFLCSSLRFHREYQMLVFFCVHLLSVLFMRGICWFVRVWDIHEHRWHL